MKSQLTKIFIQEPTLKYELPDSAITENDRKLQINFSFSCSCWLIGDKALPCRCHWSCQVRHKERFHLDTWRCNWWCSKHCPKNPVKYKYKIITCPPANYNDEIHQVTFSTLFLISVWAETEWYFLIMKRRSIIDFFS